LLVVAWTVDSALWVRGLPSLMWHVAPAVMVGYLVQTRTRSVPLLLATAAITTVAWVIIATWLRTGPRLPEMGLFLVATVWLMGIATMLLAHRGRRSFAALVPGLVAMLIVLAFLPSSFAWRLAAFLVAAAPAAGFLRAQRHADVGAPRVTTRTALAALAFAAVATGIASVAPVPDAAFRPGPISDAGDLWYDVIENAPGLFKDVPSCQEWPRIRINDTLGFTGPVASSATEVMVVSAEEPRRWRLDTFETYTTQGWTNDGTVRAPGWDSTRDFENEVSRREFIINVKTRSTMDHIATGGTPIGSTIANVAEVSGIDAPSAENPPVLSLVFTEQLIPPRSYESVGSVSTAIPPELVETGSDYPARITDRYLGLPDEFPQRVRDTAVGLASDRDNAYEIALSIQRFLRAIPYSTDVEAPSLGVDAVDWFLFENHMGFCNYYATAMITMLRSLGIPARLAIGFAPGTFIEERGGWVVQAWNYHAWPEVYFPGYGWIEFEPTNPEVQPSLLHLERVSAPRTAVQLPESLFEVECDAEGLEDTCDDEPVPEEPTLAISDAGDGGFRGSLLYWAAGGLGGFAIAIVAGALAWQRWPVLGTRGAYGAFASLKIAAWLVREPIRPHETPMELGQRLSARFPNQTDAIELAVSAYIESVYRREKVPRESTAKGLREARPHLRRLLRSALLSPFVGWRRKRSPVQA